MAPRRKLDAIAAVAARAPRSKVDDALNDVAPTPKRVRRAPKQALKEFTLAELNAATDRGFGEGYDRRIKEVAYQDEQRQLLMAVQAVEAMPLSGDTILAAVVKQADQLVVLSLPLGELRRLARAVRRYCPFTMVNGAFADGVQG